jgi:RimJ/RimL family protein N-acetyltransferase
MQKNLSYEQKSGEHADQILTEVPGVTVKDFRPEDIEELRILAKNNINPLTRAKLQTAGIIDMAEEAAEGRQPLGARRMGIWLNDSIVGAINVGQPLPNDSSEVSISYFIDKDYYKKGIASAAVRAIVDLKNSEGYDVVAEVNRANTPSVNLLKKIGFQFVRYDFREGEEIYKRTATGPEYAVSS